MPVEKPQINPVQDTTKHAFQVIANKDSYEFLNQVTTKIFGTIMSYCPKDSAISQEFGRWNIWSPD